MENEFVFKGKYRITGKIRCLTGLHVGGSTTSVEIGGVDNPVIKNPLNDLPYIPGSALKGKLRSLTEWSLGKNPYSDDGLHFTREKGATLPCSCGRCDVCVLFGTTPQFGMKKVDSKGQGRAIVLEVDSKEKYFVAGPSRLTVRDAFPSEDTKTKWEEWLGEGLSTEIKTENTLDRVTSQANPRSMERVPAGSEFDFEMILDVYRGDDHELFRALFTAMRLLENSALGGSGSRGHGQIEFRNLNVSWRSLDFYRNGTTEQAVDLQGRNLEALVKDFDALNWPSKS